MEDISNCIFARVFQYNFEADSSLLPQNSNFTLIVTLYHSILLFKYERVM